MSDDYDKLKAQKDALLAKQYVRVVHIIPVGDSGPNHHDALLTCWCHPMLELASDSGIVIHNARDCREKYERQGQAQQPWIFVGSELSRDRLIAEPPELLRLVQRALGIHSPNVKGWTKAEKIRSWRAWEAEARAAIAKAKGQP